MALKTLNYLIHFQNYYGTFICKELFHWYSIFESKQYATTGLHGSMASTVESLGTVTSSPFTWTQFHLRLKELIVLSSKTCTRDLNDTADRASLGSDRAYIALSSEPWNPSKWKLADLRFRPLSVEPCIFPCRSSCVDVVTPLSPLPIIALLGDGADARCQVT